jgi:hypothetical protein
MNNGMQRKRTATGSAMKKAEKLGVYTASSALKVMELVRLTTAFHRHQLRL